MASSRKRGSSARIAFGLVAAVAVLGAIALTGAWYYLAGQLDRRVSIALEEAAGGGATIECANREIFGYPFRLGVSCEATGIEAPANGVRATAGPLRTAAQLYRPSHIVSELGSPLLLNTQDWPPLDIRWELAQASTIIGSGGLERLSLALDAPRLALAQPAADRTEVARSDRLELHARRNAEDLDLALSDQGLVLAPPGIGERPPFDLTADLSVAGAAAWLAEGLPGGRLDEALRGREVVVRSLRLGVGGGGVMEVSGPLSFSPDGRLSGDFQVAVQNPEAVTRFFGTLVPGSAGIAGAISGAMAFAGQQEDGRTVIEISVRDGRAQIGFIPLGTLPPI